MRIQHNIPAMNALTHYTNNNKSLAGNLEKLSSGYRINSAADDAAGLAISEKMRSQIAGLEKAYDNTNDGISLVQTAEGALTEVNSMLTRLKTLATQSANGTYQQEVDREAIQQETNDILSEIDRIAQATNFNGINLLDGSLSGTDGETIAFDGTVVGLNSKMSTATNNTYTTDAFTLQSKSFADNDVLTFNVTYTDNKGVDQVKSLSYTVKDAGNNIITDENGNDITLTKIDATTLASQVIKDLAADKDFAANFKVEEGNATKADGTVKFTAVDKGTSGAALKGFSLTEIDGGTGQAVTGTKGQSANVTLGADSKKTYDLSSVTVWDGKEDTLEASIFEIDGQKFVFTDVAETALTNDQRNWLKEAGVGSNFVAGATAGLVDGDVAKMVEQIESATGLKVTQGEIDTANGNVWVPNSSVAATDTNVSDLSIIIEKASEGKALVLQVGDTNDDFQKVSVSIDDMSSKGIGIAGLDLSSQDAAGEAIDIIKNAVNTVSAQRGKLGALQNRLDHTLNNLDAMTENITSSEAQIRDTNMAKEMTAYTKNNILAQAAQSMLAQANSMPQGVLQLLQ